MSYQNPPYNPFDPGSQDLTPETPPLDQVLRMAILEAIMRLRVHLPGKIVNVRGPQLVDVQPTIQTRLVNGTVGNLPVIPNVGVQMPNGALYSIKVPVSIGDKGHIIFSDRSLDNWMAGDGDLTDPQDSRNHDMKDAIFIPGAPTISTQLTDETSDLIITAGQAKLNLQQLGTFKITNGKNELISLLDKITQQLQSLATTLSTDTVNTMLGPMKLNAFVTYEEIGQAVEELDAMVQTLKGS